MNDVNKVLENLSKIKLQINSNCKKEKISDKESIDTIELAISMLKNQLNDNWILIDEKQPEEKVEVTQDDPVSKNYYLVTLKLKYLKDRVTRVCKYDKGRWYNSYLIDVTDNVIAWQEMPKAYRQKKLKKRRV